MSSTNPAGEITLQAQIEDSYFKLKEYLVNDFNSKKAFYCLKKLSFLYSSQKMDSETASIDLLCNTGLIESIIENIKTYDQHEYGLQLQNAALWLLANIMALLQESQIMEFIQNQDILETFYFFLDSSDVNNIEQSLWTLANLISFIPIRDLALEKDIIVHVMELIHSITNTKQNPLFTVKINRTLTWLISNLCRKPSPNYEICAHFLPYLATMLHFEDQQIQRDACFAIGNMVLAESNTREDDHKQIEEILSYQIGERAILLTLSESEDVQMASLVLLGHLSYGNEIQTQYLIDLGILDALKSILSAQDKQTIQIKKEALFSLSNIIAGTQSQLDEVIQSGILETVRKQIQTTTQNQLVEECLFCLMNATYNCSEEQGNWLINSKYIYILAGQYKMKSAAGDGISQYLQESIENIIKKVSKLDKPVEKLITNIGLQEMLDKYSDKLQESQPQIN